MSIDVQLITNDRIDEALDLLHSTLGSEHTAKEEIIHRLDNGSCEFFIAIDSTTNKIVGVKLSYIDDNRAVGRGVAVLPAYRRQGIGRQLYQVFEEELKARGDVEFYVFASATSEGIPFHISNGYKPQILIQFDDSELRKQLDFTGFEIETERLNEEYGRYQIYATLKNEQQNLAYLRQIQMEMPQTDVLFLFSKPMK